MLVFNEDYFEDEYRCDFLVNEKMKRVWAAELEVLSEIIRVCKKYDLTYYADWGTLLGAVRHQGYIPWDDDIDIAMKRKDYIKLFNVLPGELPEIYDISSFYLPKEHYQPISMVMSSKVIITDPEILRKFHGCPYIVGVDVLALDYVPRDKKLAEAQRTLYSIIYETARCYDELRHNGELDTYLSQIQELCNVTFDKTKSIRKQLWLLSESVCSLYSEKESDYLTWFPETVCRNPEFKFKKDWYADTIEVPFENIMISIPKDFHEILTTMYGDYNVLKKGCSDHEYPIYRRQDEFLESRKINI